METKKGGFNMASIERLLAFFLICGIVPFLAGYLLDKKPAFTAYLADNYLLWPGVIIAAMSIWIANEDDDIWRDKFFLSKPGRNLSSIMLKLLVIGHSFVILAWVLVENWTSRFTPATFPYVAAVFGAILISVLVWTAIRFLLHCRVQPTGVILVNDDIVTPLQVLTVSPFRKYEAKTFPLFMKLERQFICENLIFILQFAVSVIDWSVRIPSNAFGDFDLKYPRRGLQAFKGAATLTIAGELNENLKKDNPLAGKSHSEYEAAQILERYFPKEIEVGVDQAEFRLKVELNGVKKRDVE